MVVAFAFEFTQFWPSIFQMVKGMQFDNNFMHIILCAHQEFKYIQIKYKINRNRFSCLRIGGDGVMSMPYISVSTTVTGRRNVQGYHLDIQILVENQKWIFVIWTASSIEIHFWSSTSFGKRLINKCIIIQNIQHSTMSYGLVFSLLSNLPNTWWS